MSNPAIAPSSMGNASSKCQLSPQIVYPRSTMDEIRVERPYGDGVAVPENCLHVA